MSAIISNFIRIRAKIPWACSSNKSCKNDGFIVGFLRRNVRILTLTTASYVKASDVLSSRSIVSSRRCFVSFIFASGTQGSVNHSYFICVVSLRQIITIRRRGSSGLPSILSISILRFYSLSGFIVLN